MTVAPRGKIYRYFYNEHYIATNYEPGQPVCGKMKAIITFQDGEVPHEFDFHRMGERHPWVWPKGNEPVVIGKSWRLLTNDQAIQLVALCDSDARQVKSLPMFDRFEILPLQWGYPDSLITDHPVEMEQMRQDHFAGKHNLTDGNYA
jgi:hypothetical protein